VSIITVTCYAHRLAFLNLFKTIKQQHYKNIKEWIVYNNTREDDQADFAKFFAKFERKYDMDIKNRIELKLLNNQSTGRNPDNYLECDMLNDLVAESTADIVVVMTDRDQYSPTRVSAAVNVLKTKKVAFNKNQCIYSHEKQCEQLFYLDTFEYNSWFATSLAFHKDVMTETNRFNENDSIYDCAVGIMEDYDDDEIGIIENDNSYMVVKSLSCNEKYVCYISDTHYSYALKRRITETKKRVDSILTNKTEISISTVICECPVCFVDTNCILKTCKHTICTTCVEMLTEPRCPLCRQEFKKVKQAVWNLEFESDYDSEFSDSEFSDDEDEDDEPSLDEIDEPSLDEVFKQDEDDNFPVCNSLRIHFNLELHAAVFDPDRVHRLCAIYNMTPQQYLNSL